MRQNKELMLFFILRKPRIKNNIKIILKQAISEYDSLTSPIFIESAKTRSSLS